MKIKGLQLRVNAALVAAVLGTMTASSHSAPLQISSVISDTVAIEKIIRNYILSNPEIVAEAISLIQEKKKLDETAADRHMLLENRKEIIYDPASPVAGNPNGDVSIVEFFGYRCGVCRQIHPIVNQLVKSDSNIRHVFKIWPILGPRSVLAGRAAIASRRQGKYHAFHKVMMETNSAFDENAIMGMAESIGIDTALLRVDLFSAETDAMISKNYALAEKLKLNGTPSFVIGDVLLRGARDLESLRRLVAAARAKKK